MLRVAVLAALAVCGVQAGYLKDFKNEGATKNKIVKVFQFPRVNLVIAHDPIPASIQRCRDSGRLAQGAGRRVLRQTLKNVIILLGRNWRHEP